MLEELPYKHVPDKHVESFNRFASFKTFKSFKLEQSQVGPNNPYNFGFVESNLVLASVSENISEIVIRDSLDSPADFTTENY